MDEDITNAAWALLMAAVLLRDIAGDMPPKQFEAMPDDIRHRLTATYYQDAFDHLPEHIRSEALRRLFADPDVQAARQLASGS